MKKVKLMLLSFSVLAVVAGALAFTAKSGIKYCTAPTNTSGSACPTSKSCPTYDSNLETTTAQTFICTAPSVSTQTDVCAGVFCAGASAQLVDE